MKQYYFLAVFFFTVLSNAQIINIPDANFKAQLLSGAIVTLNNQAILLDANGNGEIEQEEAVMVTGLGIAQSEIVSLEGIQYFTNLKVLYCNFNQITNIDYDLPLLESLWCDMNRITHLDLSHFPRLYWLNCGANLLTSLDLRQNEMSLVYAADNLLEEIHFGTLTSGAYIEVSNNQLTSLEIISPGINIHRIEFANNPLTHFKLKG